MLNEMEDPNLYKKVEVEKGKYVYYPLSSPAISEKEFQQLQSVLFGSIKKPKEDNSNSEIIYNCLQENIVQIKVNT